MFLLDLGLRLCLGLFHQIGHCLNLVQEMVMPSEKGSLGIIEVVSLLLGVLMSFKSDTLKIWNTLFAWSGSAIKLSTFSICYRLQVLKEHTIAYSISSTIRSKSNVLNGCGGTTSAAQWLAKWVPGVLGPWQRLSLCLALVGFDFFFLHGTMTINDTFVGCIWQWVKPSNTELYHSVS